MYLHCTHKLYIYHKYILMYGILVCKKYNILIHTIIATYSFSSFSRVQRGVEKGDFFFFIKNQRYFCKVQPITQVL